MFSPIFTPRILPRSVKPWKAGGNPDGTVAETLLLAISPVWGCGRPAPVSPLATARGCSRTHDLACELASCGSYAKRPSSSYYDNKLFFPYTTPTLAQGALQGNRCLVASGTTSAVDLIPFGTDPNRTAEI